VVTSHVALCCLPARLIFCESRLGQIVTPVHHGQAPLRSGEDVHQPGRLVHYCSIPRDTRPASERLCTGRAVSARVGITVNISNLGWYYPLLSIRRRFKGRFVRAPWEWAGAGTRTLDLRIFLRRERCRRGIHADELAATGLVLVFFWWGLLFGRFTTVASSGR